MQGFTTNLPDLHYVSSISYGYGTAALIPVKNTGLGCLMAHIQPLAESGQEGGDHHLQKHSTKSPVWGKL
jgi:hypothetical protein